MTDARPETLAEVARGFLEGRHVFDDAVREFLDAFYAGAPDERRARVIEAPPAVAAVHDAYLAAVAEYLSDEFGFAVPAWTEEGDRFLERPFFATRDERMRAQLLRDSPAPFRRRLIFVSDNALSRPMRAWAGRRPKS